MPCSYDDRNKTICRKTILKAWTKINFSQQKTTWNAKSEEERWERKDNFGNGLWHSLQVFPCYHYSILQTFDTVQNSYPKKHGIQQKKQLILLIEWLLTIFTSLRTSVSFFSLAAMAFGYCMFFDYAQAPHIPHILLLVFFLFLMVLSFLQTFRIFFLV